MFLAKVNKVTNVKVIKVIKVLKMNKTALITGADKGADFEICKYF